MSVTINKPNEAVISLQVQFNTKVTISDLATKEFEELIKDKTLKIEDFTKTLLNENKDIEQIIIEELTKLFKQSGFTLDNGIIQFDTDFLRDKLEVKDLSSDIPFIPLTTTYTLTFDRDKFKDELPLLSTDNKYIINKDKVVSLDKDKLLEDSKDEILDIFNSVGFKLSTDKYLKFNNENNKLEVRLNLLKRDVNVIDSPYFYQDKDLNNVLDFSKLKYDLFNEIIDNSSLIFKNGTIQVDYGRFIDLIEEKINALKVTGLNNEKMINAFNFGINECKTLINNQVKLNNHIAGSILNIRIVNFKCNSNKGGEYYELNKKDYILTGKTITLTFNPYIVFWNNDRLYLQIQYIPLNDCGLTGK